MISQRQKELLDFIIGQYVKTATPVSSALVCKKSRLCVSPATVRNEMNELEELGFLSQRHTSGGRVPTDRAYRYFVNELLAAGELPVHDRDRQHIRHAIAKGGQDSRQVNKQIAQTLSDLSGHLVITGTENQEDFFKVGLAGLFEMPEFRELNHVFQLTSFFEGFDQLFQQINRELFALVTANQPGRHFNVVIGRENPFSQIRGEAVIVAKYPLPGNVIGSLTLIGPTRMDYQKNISLIRCATQEVEKKIKEI